MYRILEFSGLPARHVSVKTERFFTGILQIILNTRNCCPIQKKKQYFIYKVLRLLINL